VADDWSESANDLTAFLALGFAGVAGGAFAFGVGVAAVRDGACTAFVDVTTTTGRDRVAVVA
jgi:hypothetical protein